jgi:hypothetical protein
MAFFEYFEYMESKIAEKEALGVAGAVVKLPCERLHACSDMMKAALSLAIRRRQNDLEEKRQV